MLRRILTGTTSRFFSRPSVRAFSSAPERAMDVPSDVWENLMRNLKTGYVPENAEERKKLLETRKNLGLEGKSYNRFLAEREELLFDCNKLRPKSC